MITNKQCTTLLQQLHAKNIRALARCISLVENEVAGYQQLLRGLQFSSQNTPVIGITGPPGAGKSTLVNALLSHLLSQQCRIAIIAVDPTSPFNYGALLGDRIRLNQHYTNPNVYIRSLATRGSLGGLSDRIMEVVDVVKAAKFDYIFVETVGVGQSEVQIAGLADTTVVVLVPEAGDDIQTMKAGLMEIANIFVVNKADRAAAQRFVKNLRQLVHAKTFDGWSIPVLKTIATQQTGIEALVTHLHEHQKSRVKHKKRTWLLTQKALQIIQKHKMRAVSAVDIRLAIEQELSKQAVFNVYTFVQQWL